MCLILISLYGIEQSLTITCDVLRFGGADQFYAEIEKKNIRLNGKWTSLKEIYGEALITVDNFRPGKTFSSIDGDYHITMSEQISNYFNPTTSPSNNKETVTSITQAINKHINGNEQELSPILLQKEPSSIDKSLTMKIIKSQVLTSQHNCLVIDADVEELFANHNEGNSMTIHEVIDKNIDESFRNIYKNLVELNPKKVIVFFDGLEKISNKHAEHVITMIDSLKQAGSAIVLSGDAQTAMLMRNKGVEPIAHKIKTDEIPINLPENEPIEIQPDKTFTEKFDDINSNVESCLSKRRRRSAAGSSTYCLFDWSDIDRFSDSPGDRNIDQLRINSDKFLKHIAVTEHWSLQKARQLIRLVKKLKFGDRRLTGQYKLVTEDVIELESLGQYRQTQRIADTMSHISEPEAIPISDGSLMTTRTIATYGVQIIPLLRGLHGLIASCIAQKNSNHSTCVKDSMLFTASVALIPAEYIAVRYTKFLVTNSKILRSFGLTGTTTFFSHVIAIIGVGLDIYNIVEASIQLNTCLKNRASCPSKVEIDIIISLTFACISLVVDITFLVVGIAVAMGLMVTGIGFIPGLAIVLVIVIGQGVALAINNVVHYSKTYHLHFDEKIRLFFSSFLFMSPPADIEALKERSDWIDYLRQRANQVLHNDTNIIAYGIGIGNYDGKNTKQSVAQINMEITSWDNTQGLSRVLPKNFDNTTLLCLPIRTNAAYEDEIKQWSTAIYHCENSFVIADSRHWDSQIDDKKFKSYIVYDLEFTESGLIVGSNTINNLFLIHTSNLQLKIIGGSSGIANLFKIQKNNFCGTIEIYETARQNLVDYSNLTQVAEIIFDWFSETQTGTVEFYGGNKFRLKSNYGQATKLHIIGRKNKRDTFNCDHSVQQYNVPNDKGAISIDGQGGESILLMDLVIDCKITTLYPFTKIVTKHKSPDNPWIVHIPLGISALNPSSTTYAIIEPEGASKVAIMFYEKPLLEATYNVTYYPNNKTLIWQLAHANSTILTLFIEPYRRIVEHQPHKSKPKTEKFITESVSAVLMDTYWNATIYPVINIPVNDTTSPINIQQFTIFANAHKSSSLDKIFNRYLNISKKVENKFNVTLKLTILETNESYIFGSHLNDRFITDKNTIYFQGGSGSDVYTLYVNSSRNIWIFNHAIDKALDILTIPDTLCPYLHAELGSVQSSHGIINNLPGDITLYCSNRGTKKSAKHNIVLREYWKDRNYRHLYIYWHDSVYIPLPYNWTHHHNTNNSRNNNIDLAFLFDFGARNKSIILTITSRDLYLLLNVTDLVSNPFVAYKTRPNNLILTKKYYMKHVMADIIILQDFFANGTNNVSKEWRDLRFFIHDDGQSIDSKDFGTIPKSLTASDIKNLFEASLQTGTDFITVYKFNATITELRQGYIIKHNYFNTSIHQG